MAGKLFYRERTKYADASHMPRYILVATYNLDLKVYGQHLRMSELKAIADSTGAELIALPRGEQSGQRRRDDWESKAS
ncbi:MAG TPA: hypothetical protein VD837_00380 [Terriglobales bacterium]|nr:hypothetical protein [Terriglobales bacterium]